MVFKFIQIFGLFLLAVACLGKRVRYENYRLYHVTASSKAELEVLKRLEESSESIVVLGDMHHLHTSMQMLLAPNKVLNTLKVLDRNKIEYKLLLRNLRRKLGRGKEKVGRFDPLQRASSYNWKQYYELDDTYSWLKQLANEHPGVVTVIEGGRTYEGRSILGVKISKSQSEKPGVLIEAGIHAREWIAPATSTYIINQLLNSQDEGVQNISLNYDWYIFPHVNPDGYVHTHTINRLWRKTRTPYGLCHGADPNRNWDFQWNVVGSSNSSCSDIFAGPQPFSEIETRSFAEYLETLRGKIFLYISFHSYSQLLLFPYGHTSDLPSNNEDFRQVFNVTVAAIRKRHGTVYTGGNIHDAIYPASGSSIDWAYALLDTKMSFCYELRPNSSQFLGFILPASQIIPTGEETLDGIVAMVNEVQRLGYC